LLPEVRRDGRDRHGSQLGGRSEQSNRHDQARWARTSFKVGDAVTVNLQPVKNGAPIGRLRTVVLPDGSTLSANGPAPAAAAPPQ
jgi:hypothetical protein